MEVIRVRFGWEEACHAEPINAAIYGRCILLGFSARETTGTTAATLTILNGQDAGGQEVMGVQLNPGGAAREWFGPQGIKTDVGIYPVITGAVAGSLLIWRGFE